MMICISITIIALWLAGWYDTAIMIYAVILMAALELVNFTLDCLYDRGYTPASLRRQVDVHQLRYFCDVSFAMRDFPCPSAAWAAG